MKAAKQPLTLVVLAAGMGSRYGGLKQIEPVGPNREILMDYSFYDAIRSGFEKIVCVIRKDIEKDFHEAIGKKWQKLVDIQYTYQEVNSYVPNPEQFSNRTKPWGTGHAILCAKPKVNTPFLVINADDFYGAESYQKMAEFLSCSTSKPDYSLVAFELQNTVSQNGSVSRGVCEVGIKGLLKSVEEHKKIYLSGDKIISEKNDLGYTIANTTPVSMNFWGFTPSIFSYLEQGFVNFLATAKENQEYFIPYVVDELIQKQIATVKVLFSKEKWLGVTYKEDKLSVQNSITKLIATNTYPDNLYQR